MLSCMLVDKALPGQCSNSSHVQVWDLRKFKAPVHVWEGLPTMHATTQVTYSPDERLILTGVSAGRDGQVIIFSFSCILIHVNIFKCICFRADLGTVCIFLVAFLESTTYYVCHSVKCPALAISVVKVCDDTWHAGAGRGAAVL